MGDEIQAALEEFRGAVADFRKKNDDRLDKLQAQVNRMNLGTSEGRGAAFGIDSPQDRGFYLPGEKLATARPPASFGDLIRAAITGQGPEAARAILLEGSSVSGGFLVGGEVVSTLIDAMRDALVCSAAGAHVVPMNAPAIGNPRVDTPPSASWVGESVAALETAMELGLASLRARKLVALLRFSRELLQDAPTAAGKIQAMLVAALASGFDRAALVGSGKGEEPLGILNTAGIGTKELSGALTLDDILDGYYSLLEKNVPEGSVSCILNASVARKMALIKSDVSTSKQLLGEAPPKEFEKIRFLVTNALPTAAGKSSIIMGDFSQLALGVRLDAVVEISRSAVVGGESAFERGQYAVASTFRGDASVENPKAFHSITNVPTT